MIGQSETMSMSMFSNDYSTIANERVPRGISRGIWFESPSIMLERMVNDQANGYTNSVYEEIIQNYKFIFDMIRWTADQNFSFGDDNDFLSGVTDNYRAFRNALEVAILSVQNGDIIAPDLLTVMRNAAVFSYQTIIYIINEIPENFYGPAHWQYTYVRLMPIDTMTWDAMYINEDNTISYSAEMATQFERNVSHLLTILTGTLYPALPSSSDYQYVQNIHNYCLNVLTIFTSGRSQSQSQSQVQVQSQSQAGLDPYL